MSQNIDELPEGGMGIKIMLALSDELTYKRTPDNKNCLSIVKNYQQPSLNRLKGLRKVSILEKLPEFFNGLNRFKDKPQRQQSGDAPIQKISLQVNTDLKNLNQVLDWYEQLKSLPIPEIVFQQCQLALAEGFTNALRHAHKNLSWETPIELEVTVFNERLEIRIWDYGQPFDLEAKLNESMEMDGELREGEQPVQLAPKPASRDLYANV